MPFDRLKLDIAKQLLNAYFQNNNRFPLCHKDDPWSNMKH